MTARQLKGILGKAVNGSREAVEGAIGRAKDDPESTWESAIKGKTDGTSKWGTKTQRAPKSPKQEAISK
jgi:hypothetical protein